MSDRVAFTFAALVFGVFALDLVLNGGDATVFLAKKFVGLIEWVAFWR